MGDDQRRVLTVLLIPLLIAGVVFAMQTFAPPPEEATIEADLGSAEAQAPNGPAAAVEVPPQRAKSERLFTLETPDYAASFSDLNAAMAKFRIKGERYVHDGEPYELVTTDKERYYPLHLELAGVAIPPDARWTVSHANDRRVDFEWQGDGVRITRSWTVEDGPYQLKSHLTIRNEGEETRTVQPSVMNAHYVRRADEKGGLIGRPSMQVSHGICNYDDDENVREDRKSLLEPMSFEPNVNFVSISNTYFSIIMAPAEGTAARCDLWSSDRGGTVEDPEGSLFESRMVLRRRAVEPGQSTTYVTAVYAGPKSPEFLEAFGHFSTEVIDLGWFSFIARGMNWLLGSIHDVANNWGLAIILLTVFVRLLLLPLMSAQYSNMAKQRALKPEIDKINEMFADDREKKGAAMMELWRKNGVNPVGGCLPVLLQMPIFFALYQSLLTNTELYRAPFALWWTDLSAPDPYYVLPVTLGLLMVVQQKLTPVALDAMQAKMMMYVMPVMITFFMLLLPTGLCLYMVTSSALGIAQQRYMYWRMDQNPVVLASNEDDDADPAQVSQSPKSSPSRDKTPRKKRPRRGRK